MEKFSPSAIKELEYYVYLYLDPDTDEVFYVGKGRGNRAFAHLEDTSENDKVERIKELRRRRKEPKIEILAHGLKDTEAAYKVEAAAIDLIGVKRLTNVQRGHHSGDYGRMSADQINAMYSAKPAKITHPSILIRINQMFRYGMSDQELYEATRGIWAVGDNRNKAELAMAVFDGIIQEVYEIREWYPAGTVFAPCDHEDTEGRWEFVGNIARPRIRGLYRLKSVREKYLKKGARNPVSYVNIG